MNAADINKFATLFAGRQDAYGSDEGSCIHKALTRDVWYDHLVYGGDRSIGVYPLYSIPEVGPVVRWGCTDIDLGDIESWPHALNLHNTLQALGLCPWIERSRSKGFHVWVFTSEPVPATWMRHAYLFAHQIADVPATEVNPKQTTPDRLKVGLGNYVRAPYPGVNSPAGRRVMIDPINGRIIPRTEFVDIATDSLNTAAQVAAVAARYVPPPSKPRVDVDTEWSGNLGPLVDRLTGLAYTIFAGGPLEGVDRSTTLARLAAKIVEGGEHSTAECFALVQDADRRWGKFFERADCDEQLTRIVEWAFQQ